jgi:small subunit ribosomal protein S2
LPTNIVRWRLKGHMKSVSLEELLEAGCHFGHQVTRQNPKARDYVFEARDGIHIIDLEKTKEGLEAAAAFIKDLAKRNGTVIILGAKRQAETIVKEEVARANAAGADGMYSVTTRWVGGTFTNLPEVSKNFRKLKHISELLKNDYEKANYTKKELSLWEKERVKLENFYGGIKEMTKVPDAIFIIDTHLEDMAVKEAHAMGVKTVGITDTNADPLVIDYPIPANDDAVGSIKLITSHIVDAWIEGRKEAAYHTSEQEGKSPKNADKPASEKKEEKTKAAGNGEAKKPAKAEKAQKSADEKSVKTAKEKIKDTAKTPEKISAE